ncbi:MAG TPA: XrtA system polysaccharide chain length determinant, partial [Rhodanobacteraceae bacterium]|nr:XrtA system polysaccharide chain length determinant [Rhodanobacteraceae bacterium]
MQKPSIDLHELYQIVLLEVRAAWRYRWHALVVAWCVMIVGALLVFSLPNQYEATAQVYADTEALTNPLLHGITVQPNPRARLEVVTHTLLSRPNLEEVADKTGLSVRATTPADKEDLLARLGSSVQIRNAGTADLYNISYSDPDRQMAKKVVQGFLTILMNKTAGANSASTAQAQDFLQQQVQEYSKRLNQQDREISDFKKNNAAYILGGGGGSYYAQLQDEENKLQNLQAQYNLVVASSGGSAVARMDPRVQDVDRQIAAYQEQLGKLLLRYTDQYPDVVTTRRMIKDLQGRRAALLKHPESTSFAGAGDAPGRSIARGLAAQIAAEKARIDDLHAKADKIADVQTRLQQLTRNYEVVKKQYDELVARLNTAQLSQDATQSGNNLKFRVINPPIAPLLPTSPHRGLLLLMVFGLAVVIGVGFAYFMHLIRPVFVSLKGLRESGDFPVLGAFSMIVSSARREERRREVIGFCAGACLLAV